MPHQTERSPSRLQVEQEAGLLTGAVMAAVVGLIATCSLIATLYGLLFGQSVNLKLLAVTLIVAAAALIVACRLFRRYAQATDLLDEPPS